MPTKQEYLDSIIEAAATLRNTNLEHVTEEELKEVDAQIWNLVDNEEEGGKIP